MAKLKNSISGFLTIVAFLVLAALAAIWQDGSQKQNNLSQDTISQKAHLFFQTVLSSSDKLSNLNLNQNVSWGEKIKNEAGKLDSHKMAAIKDKFNVSSWSEFVDKMKEEKPTRLENSNQQTIENSAITWHRSQAGDSLVIKIKNGGEYTIPLPAAWFKKNDKN